MSICKYILSLFLLASSVIGADIIESNDIKDILKHADENTLVVLDLNNTLMETAQELGSDQWADARIQEIMAITGKSKAEVLDEFVPLWHQILLVTTVKPVEKNTAEVLKELQSKNIKLIGLTARYIELAYPTHRQLRSIDIDFARKPISVLDLEVSGGFAAKLVEGILFAGLKNDKGETLFQLLDTIGYKPQKVIFVDDKLKNVQAVGKSVEKRNIPYTGIHYGFTDEKVSKYNAEVANRQWKSFLKALPQEESKRVADYAETLKEVPKAA